MKKASRKPEVRADGKRARTRAALIDAALNVIEEKGFVAASLDEIAARAGMTKGAIYSNFAGKAELMLAAARSKAPVFAPAYEPGAGLHEQLRRVAGSVATMLPSIQKSATLQAQFQLYLQGQPRLRTRIAREMTSGLRSLMGLVAEHHAAELGVTAETLVMTLQAASLGLAHQSMATPQLVSEATILAAFDVIARGAVRPADPSRSVAASEGSPAPATAPAPTPRAAPRGSGRRRRRTLPAPRSRAGRRWGTR